MSERSEGFERTRVRLAYGVFALIAFIVVWNTVEHVNFDLGVLVTLCGLEAGLLALSPTVVRLFGGK